MAMYGTGTVAARLGITRDALQYHLHRGAPKVGKLCGGRRIFTEAELDTLRKWFSERMARNIKNCAG